MKARKSRGKDIKVKRKERNAGSKLKMVRVRLKEVIQKIESKRKIKRKEERTKRWKKNIGKEGGKKEKIMK